MKKFNLIQRVMALALSLVLVLSLLPAIRSSAAEAAAGKVDASSMDSWKTFFDPTNVSSEHAGGIWTDKSVFNSSAAFSNLGINLSKNGNFLVALSALAANSVVVGQDSTPTDTMFVLDISGSMSSAEINAMITAANNSIRTLLQINAENRVGIVLYSDDAQVLLKPDRYTGVQDSNGVVQYIRRGAQLTINTIFGPYTYESDAYISTVTGLKNGKNETVSNRIALEGGTYIQGGLWAAWEELNELTDVTATARTPVVVLMSDGAPTFVTNDYSNVPSVYEYGEGNGSLNGDGFVTQLTAAYVKAQLAKKYGTTPYFYTLGLGVDNVTDSSVAVAVLNSASNKQPQGIRDYWTTFQSLVNAENQRMNVVLGQRNSNNGTTQSVVYDAATAAMQNYVDRYFSANDAAALNVAFKSIVNEISLQSGYYPTRLDDNAPNYGGYITFVDEIGMGMEVKEIEGIVIGDQLYSGLHLAEAIRDGKFGTQEQPTELGHNMVWAVKERLGIEDTAVAQRLLNNAFANGQLGYTSSTNWSNYIGWYGDADGNFLAPWPNASGAPANAKYINRSYGMLGSTTDAQTTHASDMMYIVIQVSTEIETGHQMVSFRIPASLLPVVTYEIHLNDSNDPDIATDIDVQYNGADPLRLVYEVGLRSDITPWNIAQILPADYRANADGTYNLYTNHWNSVSADLDEALKDTKNNNYTYAYFEPSESNEHYYFTENSSVLDENHNPVKSIEQGKTYYFAHRYFKTVGNGAQVAYNYEELSATALNSVVADEDGNLYVPEGVMHRNTHSHDLSKTGTTTDTLDWIRKQIVDAKVSGDDTHQYEVIYLGNNGMLTYEPGQGIKLSKVMAAGEESEEEFTFTVTLTPNGNTIAQSYETVLVDAAGNRTESTVRVSQGSFEVSLYAGQTVYILGIDEGIGYAITENEREGYRVDSKSGASGVISAYEFSAVTFTNAIQYYSTLNVVKGVEYRGGAAAPANPTRTFPVTVALTVDGGAYAGKTVAVDGINKTTDANGRIALNILDGQKITITGLPVGAAYTVTEGTLEKGYKWENPNDPSLSGTVALAEQTAIILNSYTPEGVELTENGSRIDVYVDKLLQHADLSPITDWATDKFSFEFNLERFDGSWKKINGVTMTDSNRLALDMMGQTFKATGSYFFRVSETVGSRSGMTYDRTLHIFEVVVTDTDLDGTLEISDVKAVQHATVTKPSETAWTVLASFTNTYEPKSTKLALEATKALSGRELKANEFTFQLYTTGSTYAIDGVVPEEATNGLLGDIVFEPDTYTAAGKYYYVLKEVAGASDTGVRYDDTVYQIQVTVENINDQLEVTEIAVNGETVQNLKETLIFRNIYTSEMKTTLEIKGHKTLTGRDITANDNFRFSLVSSDGSYRHTVSCGIDGNFSFNGLKFEAAGTYHYTINEEIGNLGGVTYDTKVHQVVVTVTDNGEGELLASYTIDGVANATASFVNVYTSVMTTPVVIEGIKTLKGRDLRQGEFTFELWSADEYGVEGKLPRRTVTNTEKGSFAFEPMTFAAAGQRRYIVVETKGSLGGVTYDETVYEILVTVTDNGMGQLVGGYTVDGEANKPIAFENTYKAAPVSIALSGKKILTGRDLLEGEFSFRLEAIDNAPMPATAVVTNGVEGKITFEAVEYSAVGEYRYTLREEEGNLGGITYDPAVYEVTVIVTDNGEGELVATVKALHTGINIETPVIEFFNRYRAGSVDVVLKGTKTLEDGVLSDGEFTFVLTHEQGNVVQTVTNANGAFSFDALNFAAPGTYTYTIHEDNSEDRIDIVYDETIYQVTIEVTDGLEGHLVATVNGEAVEAFSADFVNRFVEVPPQTGDNDILILVMSVVALGSLIALYVMRWNKRKWVEE